jgi:acyl carrier protein
MLTIITNLKALQMNKHTNTEKRVLDITKAHLGLLALDVTLDKSFVKDLDCDEIALVELLMKIEDEFNVELDDDLWLGGYDKTTLADVVRMITEVTHG